MKYIFQIIVISNLFGAFAIAQGSDDDYLNAYNACKSVAEKGTKEQCNYGRVFEHYYSQCMNQYGYNDSSADNEGYVKAYKYCSYDSDFRTKENCNYGVVYNQKYNQCIRQHGFNANGERVPPGQQEYFKFDF